MTKNGTPAVTITSGLLAKDRESCEACGKPLNIFHDCHC